MCAAFVAGAIAAPRSAEAAPYEFIAIYQAGDKTIDVPIEPDALLPASGERLQLLRVVARFSQDGLGGTTTALFKNFSVGIRSEGVKIEAHGITADKIGPKTDLVLFESRDVTDGKRRMNFALDVHGKFAEDYLCAEETNYRRDLKKSKNLGPVVIDPKLKKAGKPIGPTGYAVEDERRGDLFMNKVAPPDVQIADPASGAELMYSFCSPSAVNWNAVAKLAPYLLGSLEAGDSDAVKEAHRRTLAEILIKNGTLKRFSTASQPVKYGLDDKNDPIDRTGAPRERDVFIAADFRFSLIQFGDFFSLTEESRDRIHDGETTLFDQDSRLAIRVASSPGGACPDLTSTALVYRIQKTADSAGVDVQANTTATDIKTDFRQPCKVTLGINLKDYLDNTATLTVYYKLRVANGLARDVQEVRMFKTSFRVAHLGVIASLPVASEIYTAATSKSFSDINASSSIPLSYAVRYRGDGARNNLAVTFPLRLGYNFRAAPDLATKISVFAHFSFIFSAETAAKPVAAFGFGVTALQTLHVSWGFDLDGGRYLLAGISVTDIAKAFKKGDN